MFIKCSDIAVRYNPETDYIQAKFNGVWYDVYDTKIQNYDIPTMTSNTFPYGVASASSYRGSGEDPYMAFDKKPGTRWRADTINNWIQYEFDRFIIPRYYSFIPFYDSGLQGSAFYFQASKDGKNFDELDFVRITNNSASEVHEHKYLVETEESYRFFRLYITESLNAYKIVGVCEFNVSGMLAPS